MLKEFPEIPLEKMRSVVGRFGITGTTQTLKIKVRPALSKCTSARRLARVMTVLHG